MAACSGQARCRRFREIERGDGAAGASGSYNSSRGLAMANTDTILTYIKTIAPLRRHAVTIDEICAGTMRPPTRERGIHHEKTHHGRCLRNHSSGRHSRFGKRKRRRRIGRGWRHRAPGANRRRYVRPPDAPVRGQPGSVTCGRFAASRWRLEVMSASVSIEAQWQAIPAEYFK